MTLENLAEFLKNNGFKLNKSEQKALKLKELEKKSKSDLEPEIIEIEMVDVDERIGNNNSSKPIFGATEITTFEEKAANKKKYNKNREFTLDEIGKKNVFTSNYYPKNYNR